MQERRRRGGIDISSHRGFSRRGDAVNMADGWFAVGEDSHYGHYANRSRYFSHTHTHVREGDRDLPAHGKIRKLLMLVPVSRENTPVYGGCGG